MHSRRKFIALASTGLVSLAGCLENADDGGSGPVDQTTGDDGSGGSTSPGANTPSADTEPCVTETRTESESVVSNRRTIEGGYEWTHGYRAESGDEVTFEVSASNGQDVAVEIDSPRGSTIHTETGVSVITTELIGDGGSGEVRVKNLGERTKEEREELWSGREEYDAGGGMAPWTELNKGDSVDYRVRMVDGARPNLRIETADGDELREHAVSEVIDDEFEAPEDGRYYFYAENTAIMTSGTWDYSFERIEQVPIETSVSLEIDREYEEQVEVCD